VGGPKVLKFLIFPFLYPS